MRRRLVLALAGAGLLVALVLTLVLTGRDDPPGTAAAASSATATTPVPPSSAPVQGPSLPRTTPATSSAAPGPATAPTPSAAPAGGAAEQRPAELSAVPLDGSATMPDVVSGRLVAVEAVQATGSGVGNVSGPALRVTVELTGAGRPLPLDGSYVEVLTGPELTPASPVDDPSTTPLQGELPPGGTATGVYVFGVDEGARDDVTVRVQPAPGEPFLVFRGAAG